MPAAPTLTARASSAGSVSLSTKPLAPARSAATTYSSAANVVRTRTFTSADSGLEVMCRVASMPSMPGIRMSISTTSGRCRCRDRLFLLLGVVYALAGLVVLVPYLLRRCASELDVLVVEQLLEGAALTPRV